MPIDYEQCPLWTKTQLGMQERTRLLKCHELEPAASNSRLRLDLAVSAELGVNSRQVVRALGDGSRVIDWGVVFLEMRLLSQVANIFRVSLRL